MTNGEISALVTANRYRGDVTIENRIKWLAGEVAELAMAFQSGDEKDLLEEAGDCAFLLSHIISHYDKEGKGITHFISLAADKMERRNSVASNK